LRQLERDLDKLGDKLTQVSVARRSLKVAGAAMLADVKGKALNSLDDIGKLSNSIRFRSKASKVLGMVSVWIQPVYNLGGELGTIFEKGTKDRHHKDGWWTGKIREGKKKTGSGNNNLSYLKRGFDIHAISTGEKIIKQIGTEIDLQVAKSRILTKK